MSGPVDIARRAFLRRGAVAAAAAPMIPAALANGAPVAGSVGYLGNAIAKCGMSTAPASNGFKDIAINEFFKVRRDRDQANSAKFMVRQRWGGFDPDIACLRSVSPAIKTRMQVDRETREERENQSFLVALKKRLGLPEDF